MRDTKYTTYAYYAGRVRQVITDEELENPEFIRKVRNFAASQGVSHWSWLEHMMQLYRDSPSIFVNAKGDEQLLSTVTEFERTGIEYWFRDFCRPVPPHTKPFVRKEARERVRILATILSAYWSEV